MLPLRYPTLWRTLSAVLLGAVLVAAVLPTFWFDSQFEALSWFENADKWLHGITFAALAVWFAGLFPTSAYWRIAIGLSAFGLIVEGCQLSVGYRMADWIDIGANTAGIIAGLAAAAAGLGGWGLLVEDRCTRRNPH
ncbi:MAG: VanZ family protein [Proteobacteria bacterium]|nr:VanZ family protein [Pseudomonadota bacterium]